MLKMPTIFKRNPENRKMVMDEPHPDCQWVFEGEGEAVQKYDGTCCMVKNKQFFKRREVKKGKAAPNGFIPLSTDPVTGKSVGWIPVHFDDPANKYHMEAYGDGVSDGTYELIGPCVQGNPENCDKSTLFKHTHAQVFMLGDRTYNGIRLFLKDLDVEGVVFRHKDGRMAKIKKRDFGMKRINS